MTVERTLRKRSTWYCCWQLLTFIAAVPLYAGIATLSFATTGADRPEPGMQRPMDEGDQQSDQRQGRTPPKVAIEACTGKQEGDPCRFTNRNEVLDGECRSGTEQVFACRPHRQGKPGIAAQTGESGHPAGLSAANKDKKAPATPQRQKDGDITPTAVNLLVQTIPPARQVSDLQTQSVLATQPANSAHWLDKSGFMTNRIVVDIGLCLASVLGSIIITWYIFYRQSTLPLRRLRMVTQKLAGGDLSARVGEGLIHRKNEVAYLARDVDRMAERFEGLVGAHQRLIRDVSHELRSPLARLNVALELARQSAGPTHTAPFDRIERESDRLNELIGQLLMLTKLESESGMTRKAVIDIAALVMEIIHDVDFEARNNDREVIAGDCEPLLLNGDRELLRQALENLVRNAIRYTNPGTAVEVSLQRKESGGRNWAHVEVRDHGPGVPEAELVDIFRPFYRVSDSRERQSGGTGVGLAISDRAVRLHGGKVRAFNAPGGGLVMEMELPLPV